MAGTRVLSVPRIGTTRTVHAPSSNTAAVVTLAAVPSYRRIIRTAFWSYNAAPTGGNILIADATVTQLNLDITSAGPAMMPIEMTFGANTEVVVTLAAGGSGVSGKVVIESYLERQD